MAYKPNKTTALFFSVAIIVFGTIVAMRNDEDSSFIGAIKSPPRYFGVGLIVIGAIGVILIWARSRGKTK